MWRTVQLNTQSYENLKAASVQRLPLEGGDVASTSPFIVLFGVCCCLILKGSLSYEARNRRVTQAGFKLLGGLK